MNSLYISKFLLEKREKFFNHYATVFLIGGIMPSPERTREIEHMLAGQGLTTANIYYHMPDFQTVLQTYLWQDYDTAPDFPKLHGFLDFWKDELEGPIH